MQQIKSPPKKVEIDQALTQRYDFPYCVAGNCLYQLKQGKDGISQKKLCNFVPWITAQETVFDGEKEYNRLHISGIKENGRALREIEIEAKDLSNLSWVLDKWGADCNISVGNGVKECVRHAIQMTMKSAKQTFLYTVTGWLKIGGKYRYLMPGEENLNVILPGKLSSYSLPSEQKNDFSPVIAMLSGSPANDELMLPLLSFVFLTPLNHFLKMVNAEPKTVMFLCGRTGSKKSTLAALMLSFYGRFTSSNLPLSFRDTANSIISNLFTLKDVLTCVDDFHPTGRNEESKMNCIAQSVMRAVGDRTGRARLNQRSELMNSKPPQGNVIITGEIPPEIGESGTARYFMLEIEPETINTNELTSLQCLAENGVLQWIMSEYITWLKKKFLSSDETEKNLLKRLSNEFKENRTLYSQRLAAKGPVHGRIPEALANMETGIIFLLEFLTDKKAIGDEEKDFYHNRFIEVVTELAKKQSETVSADKPTRKFLSKFFSLVDSDSLRLAKKNSLCDYKVSGYYDDDRYYLFGQEAHKNVKRFCEEQGEIFSITSKALFKALVDEGFAEAGKKENTQVLRICGSQKRFLVLKRQKVDELLGSLVYEDYPSQPSQPDKSDEWEELYDEDLPFD